MYEYENVSKELCDEACRIVGQCCLALADNGAETNREQFVRRSTGCTSRKPVNRNLSMLFSIEKLATSEDWKNHI